jgi:hypothetical protein
VVFEIEKNDVGRWSPDATTALTDTSSPVLWTEIPGAALSWTPATEDCLERGRSYAWFVRGTSADDDEPWSEAKLFEIGGAPSREEVEAALDTLHRYLGQGRGESAEAGGSVPSLAAAMNVAVGSTVPAPAEDGRELPAPAALPAGFEVGLSAAPSGGAGTVGVHGMSSSTVNESAGVVGEALAGAGIADGVRGVSASTSGTGVRGSASALTGITAGVWGAANSPAGYGGFFFNLGLGDPGGTGLFGSGALNSSPDLVLGGNLFWPQTDQDDGRIHSAPAYPSSDIVLQSNDDVVIVLNSDDDGDDADFTIRDGAGQNVFNVDQTGTTVVQGDLFLIGSPEGGLVSLDEVQQLIDAHRAADHPKLVFVTSQTYNGNLGGVAGADQECRTLALDAGLLGTFKAWISGDDATDEEARDRLTHADVPYRRVDNTKVADNWDDLTDGTLDAAIRVDENGNTVGSTLTVYTNTNPNGSRVAIDRECGPSAGVGDDWDSSSTNESGAYGTVTAASANWSFTSNDNCSIQRRLYCFEQ